MNEEQRKMERRQEFRENRVKNLSHKRNEAIKQTIYCASLLAVVAVTIVIMARFLNRDQTVKPPVQAVATPIATKPPEVQDNSKEEFEAFYYYNPELLDQYQAYQQQHESFSPADVVWRVNSRLHLEPFNDAILLTADQLDHDPLVIVNKYHRVPEEYEPSDLTENSDGILMRYEAQKAFDLMKEEARKEGYDINSISGYRSVAYQEEVYNTYLTQDSFENVERYSARPGFSEHHTGLAVDVAGSQNSYAFFGDTPEYEWVLQNGHHYGFIIRYTASWEDVTGYQEEPWHLRYVGKKVATQMKEENISSLEEYRAKYQDYKN